LTLSTTLFSLTIIIGYPLVIPNRMEVTMEEKHSREKHVLEGSSFNFAIARLGEYLSTTGHARSISAEYTGIAKHFFYWLTSEYRGPWVVDEPKLSEFLTHLVSCRCPVSRSRTYRQCHAALNHLLAVLRELGLAPPPVLQATLPYDNVLQSFRKHLTEVRGTTESTASLYLRHLKPFLQDIYREGKLNFREITVSHVKASVAHKATTYKPKTVKSYCTSLRAFFRFLRLIGETELSLEHGVPTVPEWKLSTIPKYLRKDQIDVFMASFRDTPIGLRDRAMAILMGTVGLRAGEVANLKIDDIDWRKSSIRLDKNKSSRIDYLPLVSRAGEALAAYLQRRPQSVERHLFVTHLTPVGRPLTSSAVSMAIRRAFMRCYPGEPSRGPHVLRHTLATGLLAKGATFKEIADILRHKSIETTTIYAKVDIEGLKHVVLPWPEVTL
jgi:site-specific recombinase XerD